MAINNKLEYTVLELIEASARYAKTRPLNLGGVSGPGGGVGLPPGGFIGQLPQTRVAYDEDEIASSGTPASGMSLLDNLNHIRYRLDIIESGGSIWVVDDDTATTYQDVDTIHFSGAGVVVSDLGGGDVRVTISATGSGGSMPSPFALPNDITPPSFSATQNNYNPTGLGTADVVRLSATGNRTITGLAGGSDGRIIILQNIGSGNINLSPLDSSSSSSNQFDIISEGHTLVSGSSVDLRYDSILSKWKVIGGDSVAAIQGVPVEASLRAGIENGNVLAYDGTTGLIIARSPLSVLESDGSPIITPTWSIAFSGATVTDLGSGSVLVTISGAGLSASQYLKLDASNDPVTGQLSIVNAANGAGGIYVETVGDSYTADFEQFVGGVDSVTGPVIFGYRDVGAGGSIAAHLLELAQYETDANSITGDLIHASTEGAEVFSVDRDGNVDIKTGSLYKINGSAHTHDNSTMTNRTRYIPVVSVYDASAGTTIPATDAHGTFSQEAHFHLADAATTIIKSTFPIPVPEDYVSGTVTINYNWSSSVANNNVRWQVIVRETGTNDVVHTSLLTDTSTVAVGATANAMLGRSISLTTNPTAGKKLSFNIIRLGADGADTNTGQVSLWGVWLEYTADM